MLSPGFEDMPQDPVSDGPPPQELPFTLEDRGYSTMMVTDFTLPEDHPDRNTAILLTAEELTTFTSDAANGPPALFWHRDENGFSIAQIPANAAWPFQLALHRPEIMKHSDPSPEIAKQELMRKTMNAFLEQTLLSMPGDSIAQ